MPDPGEKITKKNSKKIRKIKQSLSGDIYSHNGMIYEEIGLERDKIILDTNSAHTRPGGENSEKRTAKKLKKIREQLFGIIFCQIRMRQAEKE